MRRILGKSLAVGIACAAIGSPYGAAHADSTLNEAPYAAPAEGQNFYIIAPGGKQILSLERNFFDVSNSKRISVPAIKLGSFASIWLNLVGSQTSDSISELALRDPFSCADNQTCWKIHHVAVSDDSKERTWILGTLREDVYIGEPQNEFSGPTGKTRTLPAGMPIWQRLSKDALGTPHAWASEGPYLVLQSHPTVPNGYLIREYKFDEPTATWALTDRVLYNRGKSNEIFNQQKVASNSYWLDYYMNDLVLTANENVFYLKASGGCALIEGTQCYWMENTSGNSCWVKSPVSAPFIPRCFELDSCDGGEGQSAGGCYKWADCSTCTRTPWK